MNKMKFKNVDSVNQFFILKADGTHIPINAENVDQSQYKLNQMTRNTSENDEYLARQIQLSIFHALRDIEEYKVEVDENLKILKTDCQYVMDTYEGICGLHILTECHGSNTTDLKMKFLSRNQVNEFLREAA